MQIFRGERLLKPLNTESMCLKYKKEIQEFLNTIQKIHHCKTLDDEIFFFAYGNTKECNKLKSMGKEDIQDLFGDWSGWEYFANKIHLTDFFVISKLEFEELSCLVLFYFEKILTSHFPNRAFMTFLTCDQKVWEDEREDYIYSTFCFAKARNGVLMGEPKHYDDTIIYARIGRG